VMSNVSGLSAIVPIPPFVWLLSPYHSTVIPGTSGCVDGSFRLVMIRGFSRGQRIARLARVSLKRAWGLARSGGKGSIPLGFLN
jgi:hypothetical protein